ncbi:holo-ACP synthase [Metabacillus malikii]|uniref:Holo-[acyl-carrier-protein] synthase n=1 Tax=Metabacillus malikii TaxID=1504265 RepID=A0ABT9ZAM8_9BACI|nr:holo-ACP synthase [Metabacillus malikii]MDQ0229080.1 holo-[acyl-carrier protein] synthase [Metabacillus malikii]
MGIGLGMDLVELNRINLSLERSSGNIIKKVLHPSEIERYEELEQPKRKLEWFAGRLAAKEAVKKAIGNSIEMKLRLIDIIIRNDRLGKPCVQLSEEKKTGFEEYAIEITITHSERTAAAVAILYPKQVFNIQ